MTTHLIIGSGFAALKAAETIRQLDAEAAITVLTEENDPPYWRPRLPDVIAKQVTEDKVQMKPRAYFAEKKIDLRLGARVVKVLPLENRLLLSDGSSAGYDTLLLASGSLAHTRSPMSSAGSSAANASRPNGAPALKPRSSNGR